MFNLVIIEAERIDFDGLAKIVNVPTENGIEGILSNHAPMVSKIGHGVLEYETDNGERVKQTVADGYLFVWNNDVKIIVNSTEKVNALEVDTILARIEHNEKVLETSTDKREIAQAKSSLRKDQNRLNAFEKFIDSDNQKVAQAQAQISKSLKDLQDSSANRRKNVE